MDDILATNYANKLLAEKGVKDYASVEKLHTLGFSPVFTTKSGFYWFKKDLEKAADMIAELHEPDKYTISAKSVLSEIYGREFKHNVKDVLNRAGITNHKLSKIGRGYRVMITKESADFLRNNVIPKPKQNIARNDRLENIEMMLSAIIREFNIKV